VNGESDNLAKYLVRDSVVRAIFEHVRNLIVATVVIAVGMRAIRSDAPEVLVPYPSTAGYVVAGIGALLLLLNFVNGLLKLSGVRFHYSLQIMMAFAYAFLTWRVFQMIFVFN
jgi:hypothetical protein